MNGNEVDDLFRSNADYLADQPHRDFNAEAFWQQLQPALPARQKRSVGWYPAAAAAALLLAAGLAGLAWLYQPESPAALTYLPAPVPAAPPRPAAAPVADEQPARQQQGTWRRPAIPAVTPAAPAAEAPNEVPSEEPLAAVAEAAAGELAEPATAAPPALAKPAYRVVHRNELDRQPELETKARAQVVFRIGLPAAAATTTPTETRNLLTFPIPN
jgi:hypothetical protein